jgi:Mg-chelatase subunit ChlD
MNSNNGGLDIVFLIDYSGSMGGEISGVINGSILLVEEKTE